MGPWGGGPCLNSGDCPSCCNPVDATALAADKPSSPMLVTLLDAQLVGAVLTLGVKEGVPLEEDGVVAEGVDADAAVAATGRVWGVRAVLLSGGSRGQGEEGKRELHDES